MLIRNSKVMTTLMMILIAAVFVLSAMYQTEHSGAIVFFTAVGILTVYILTLVFRKN